jgi:hypothetical protein
MATATTAAIAEAIIERAPLSDRAFRADLDPFRSVVGATAVTDALKWNGRHDCRRRAYPVGWGA